MGEQKESHEGPGMCFDNMSLAELRKLMGKEGIGSLCREMMDKIVQAGKGESACLQFMRKMTTEHGKTQEEGKKDKERSRRDSKEDRRTGQ